jgi:hypothetical protein
MDSKTRTREITAKVEAAMGALAAEATKMTTTIAMTTTTTKMQRAYNALCLDPAAGSWLSSLHI